MKRLAAFASLLALTLGAGAPVSAQTIGYVDMKEVISESKQGKAVQEKIRAEFEAPRQALLDEEKSIVQEQQDLQRDLDTLSEEQAASREAALKERIGTFQQRGTTLQQRLLKAQQNLAGDVLNPARDAINAVAKEKGVGMVIEQSISGLLYLDPGLNLTADVIKRMDAQN